MSVRLRVRPTAVLSVVVLLLLLPASGSLSLAVPLSVSALADSKRFKKPSPDGALSVNTGRAFLMLSSRVSVVRLTLGVV